MNEPTGGSTVASATGWGLALAISGDISMAIDTPVQGMMTHLHDSLSHWNRTGG